MEKKIILFKEDIMGWSEMPGAGPFGLYNTSIHTLGKVGCRVYCWSIVSTFWYWFGYCFIP